MPYFPGGVDELPQSRVVLFADETNTVRALDESLLTSLIGEWMSPSLNREDITRIYTLRRLMLLYEAQASTTLLIRASGNGGETFLPADERTVAILQTAERHRRLMVSFNTSGFDLRFRLDFNTGVLVNVLGYVAYVQLGTDHAVGL